MPLRKGPRAPRIVRHTLVDGTVKEYRYGPHRKPKRPKPSDTIDALLEAFRRSPEWGAFATHTRTVYSIYFREIERVGQVRVRDVQRRELLLARDAILQKRGPGAAKSFAIAIGSLFSWALDRGWVDYSPATRLKRGLRGSHLPAWTAHQADMAEALLPEHLRRVVVLARYTGQRRSDLCAMTWGAFDGERIKLRQQKTGEDLVIPCHPTLKAELISWRSTATAVTILTNASGAPWLPAYLTHVLPKALLRIGLPAGMNVHGLRKLAATSLADAGCTTHEIAAITGHRTLGMIQHYTRTADQERLAGAAIVRLQTVQKKSGGS